MLKNFLFAAIAASLVVFSASNAVDTSSNSEASGRSKLSISIDKYLSENGDDDCETADMVKRLADANTKLTMLCLYHSYRTEPFKSHVTTIVPILKLAAMCALYGPTALKAQCLAILNLNSEDEVIKGMSIVEKIANVITTDYSADIDMELIGNKDYPYNDSFMNTTKEVVNISTVHGDYNNFSQLITEINEWVQSTAKYEVPDVLCEGDLSAKSGGIIAGQSTFETWWSSSLVVEDAEDIVFRVTEEETQTVPSIHCYGDNIGIATIEEYSATVISLPLTNDCHMNVLHANNPSDFGNLVYAIRNPDLFNEIMSRGESQRAHVYMPNNTFVQKLEDYILGLKLSGYIYQLLVLNETSVSCPPIYAGSNAFGYLSNMPHDITLSIKSQCTDTTERRRRDTTDAEASDSQTTDSETGDSETSDSVTSEPATSDSEATQTSSDSEASTEYTYILDSAFVTFVMCPLETPHYATYYGGSSN